VHNLQRVVRRQKNTIKSLTEALADCQSRNRLSEAAEQSLLDSFGSVAQQIMLNEIKNAHVEKHGRRYSHNMRAFALTAFYYSPRVYQVSEASEITIQDGSK